MTSIPDVAREANVAASTVYRVINGSSRISPKTQQRVHEAIRRVGYLPNGGSRRRKQQRAWHLGVVYSPNMIVNGALVKVCRDWITGVREVANEADGHLEVFAGAKHVEQDAMYRHSLEAGELHGLILLGTQRDSHYVEDTQARGVPVVIVSDRSRRGDISSIYADMYNAGRRAVDHLVNLGHQRIGLGHLPTGALWSSDRRRQGALDALAEHGLTPAFDRQSAPKFNDIAYFNAAAAKLLEAGATAMLASDFAAARYIEALHRHGVCVPKDFSVVGCDNAGVVPETGQVLTTIDYDKPFMGRLAAHTLINLIQNRGHIQHVETSVPTQLLERETTAPPPTP